MPYYYAPKPCFIGIFSMDLTARAVGEWHALMPADLRRVIADDALPSHDVIATRLVEDLSVAGPDLLAQVLVRHAGTIAAFGQARRIRMLADLATTHPRLPALVESLLADPMATPVADLIREDIELLARIVSTRTAGMIDAASKGIR